MNQKLMTGDEVNQGAAIRLYKESCQKQYEFQGGLYQVAILPGSAPTLWFGSQGMADHPIKIVTVANNPAAEEFTNYKLLPTSGSETSTVPILADCTDEQATAALAMQRDYFENRTNLNSGFFSGFESFLEPLGCSYLRGKRRHLAAHLDLCTPFSTKKNLQNYKWNPNKDAILHDGFSRFESALGHFGALEVLIGIGTQVSWALQDRVQGRSPFREGDIEFSCGTFNSQGRDVLAIWNSSWFSKSKPMAMPSDKRDRLIGCIRRLLDTHSKLK